MTKKTDKKIVEVTPTVEIKQSFPTMSSFTIKATIPTGAYSNISPEMTFNDCSFDDVTKVILPRMEDMFLRYLGFNDKVIAQQKLIEEALRKANTPAPATPEHPAIAKLPHEVSTSTEGSGPAVNSPSMANALKVVDEAKTVSALTLIKKSVADSVKLTVDEQVTLNLIINDKIAELSK